MLFQRPEQGGVEWIICCLGNPGREYDNTRHNVGFLTADALEKRTGVPIRRIRFKALTAVVTLGGRKTLLMKPNTFMNLSGTALAEAAAFYKVPPERCLVVADDVTLDLGRLRLRRSGSAGGHNGLKSIINMLGTSDFPRLKIGVGQKPHPDYDLAAWVLGKFTPQEQKVIAQAAQNAAEAAECVLAHGMDQAMNRYNGG
ncbi:MAG TPA: aminoacyl-tRNA hydrolase [Candidatus Onthomonas avicola]|nr:aminoacyl-tRNA hydrolase [Candidatus Onthomonas avicola]